MDVAVAFDRSFAVDGAFGFGDLFINPTQRPSCPVMAILVVDDPIGNASGLLTAGGGPRLSQHQPIGKRLVGALVAPFSDDLGQPRDSGAEDERQSGGLHRDLVASEIMPTSATTVTSVS